MGDQWTRTEEKLPPPGVAVETISPGGLQQRLKIIDGFWFVEDGSISVYYVPTFWRHV